jgi:hypothetical protein
MGMGTSHKHQVGHVEEFQIICILTFSQDEAFFSFFHDLISLDRRLSPG